MESVMAFAQRVTIVTGATSGIGAPHQAIF
jgi:NADP-dependent 3-hydroxy acid dehydrogenase YdfG